MSNTLKPSNDFQSKKQQFIEEIKIMLGHPVIDIELSPEHYELSLKLALEKWRQISPNSIQDSITTLDLVADQNQYYLPKEVVEVRKIFRRNITGINNGVAEPFSLAFAAQFSIAGLGNGGDLVTYYSFRSFQKVLGKLFGGELDFIWNPTTKMLDILRHIREPESVLLQVYVERPIDNVLDDPYSGIWLRDYTVARCKVFLGDIRGKYTSLAGPNGTISLNGESIKQEGIADMQRLEAELKSNIDGTYLGVMPVIMG